jgi:hypothetical protein
VSSSDYCSCLLCVQARSKIRILGISPHIHPSFSERIQPGADCHCSEVRRRGWNRLLFPLFPPRRLLCLPLPRLPFPPFPPRPPILAARFASFAGALGGLTISSSRVICALSSGGPIVLREGRSCVSMVPTPACQVCRKTSD